MRRFFHFDELKTDLRTEILAGITTFLTMAYIIFVNPEILAKAGMDWNAVFVATCLAAAIATLLMGLYARYPIALARDVVHRGALRHEVHRRLDQAKPRADGSLVIGPSARRDQPERLAIQAGFSVAMRL
jgi:hypothetical protein